MNILIIHNYYSTRGGEESVVEFQKQILESKGHNVYLYTRHYNEMNGWLLGKSWGTFTSIFNPKSRRDLDAIINDFQPEVAILHNLFPIISPSIIPYLSKKGVKVCQVVHNYRMFCPIGLFYTKNQICFKCLNFPREFNCFLNKCNKNYFASLSFSIRSYIVRVLNYYHFADQFIVLSSFQKEMLSNNGFKNNISILPNALLSTESIEFQSNCNINTSKMFIGYVGRLSEEKGFIDFIKIANLLPKFDFKIAGGHIDNIIDIKIPSNLHFEGVLNKEELNHFYMSAKLIVVPSKCLETFGLVIIESFANRTPVIANKVGGIIDIIEHGKNGYLVDVGDIESTKNYILEIFNNDQKYKEMSDNAYYTFQTKFSSELYYEKLMVLLARY